MYIFYIYIFIYIYILFKIHILFIYIYIYIYVLYIIFLYNSLAVIFSYLRFINISHIHLIYIQILSPPPPWFFHHMLNQTSSPSQADQIALTHDAIRTNTIPRPIWTNSKHSHSSEFHSLYFLRLVPHPCVPFKPNQLQPTPSPSFPTCPYTPQSPPA